VIRSIWLGIRIFLGSYVSGLGPALAIFVLLENGLLGYYTFIFATPVGMALAWFITPVTTTHPRASLINHVVLGTLLVFFWACIVAAVLVTDLRPMPHFFQETKLVRFYLISTIAGAAGMLLNVCFLQRRLEGKTIEFKPEPPTQPPSRTNVGAANRQFERMFSGTRRNDIPHL
jgi:hypothetical protein